ncbi:hypothetical protein TNCV_222051 [Trichonephila clavipes]|nr:hypothetical protein TNCV_222051 [Trichonephila clavipes]
MQCWLHFQESNECKTLLFEEYLVCLDDMITAGYVFEESLCLEAEKCTMELCRYDTYILNEIEMPVCCKQHIVFLMDPSGWWSELSRRYFGGGT